MPARPTGRLRDSFVGLQEGNDGFPAPRNHYGSALLPQVEGFSRTLKSGGVCCGVVFTRVWLLFNKDNPSRFVEALNSWMPAARKFSKRGRQHPARVAWLFQAPGRDKRIQPE